ncbi:hypothetical protein CQA86_32105, partial [Klebsiella pneumoniae]
KLHVISKRYTQRIERHNLNLRGTVAKLAMRQPFCLIQRPYISKTLLTRRISPRGSP